MNIVMLGAGYVGLVSGACFSEFGFNVTCLDKDKSKIENLNKGCLPIYEPGLDILVKKNISSGRLNFSVENKECIKNVFPKIPIGIQKFIDLIEDLNFYLSNNQLLNS